MLLALGSWILNSFHSMDRFYLISLARLTPQPLMITKRNSLHQIHEFLLLGHGELAPIALESSVVYDILDLGGLPFTLAVQD